MTKRGQTKIKFTKETSGIPMPQETLESSEVLLAKMVAMMVWEEQRQCGGELDQGGNSDE